MSTPACRAAAAALRSKIYCRRRFRETDMPRQRLTRILERAGVRVVPGATANFLMGFLDGTDEPGAIFDAWESRGLYVRRLDGLSPRLGPGAFRVAVQGEAALDRMEAAVVRRVVPQ